MLYNVPGRTGVAIDTETIVKLYDDVENIYAIKEASGDINKIVELQSLRKDLILVSGEDAIDFPILASGGKGIISVTANILPNLKSKLVHDLEKGDWESAKKINEDLFELNRVLFCESNPIPIKAAMYIAGLLDTLEFRLPLTAPSAETMKKLEETLKNYEVIK
jgi:4-hydroxy-tetrahydrodipicolinate synthase